MNLPAIPQKKQTGSGFGKMLSLGMLAGGAMTGNPMLALGGLSGIANQGSPDISLAAQGLRATGQPGGGWQNSLGQGMYTQPEDGRFSLGGNRLRY